MGERTTIKVSSGSSGVVALIIAFFFGPFGAFFCWWLIAKWSFVKSFLYAVLFFVLLGISVWLCWIFIGFILIPIVDIVMLVLVYKACSNKTMEIETPYVEKRENSSAN